jgi:phenylacetate-CoA ligase
LDFRPELSWEFLAPEEIEAKSVRALRNHIRHLKECSGFYRTVLELVAPEDITDSAAISGLPLTTREQLAGQSSRFLGVGAHLVVETIFSAGTGGTPLPFIFTASDLDRIAYNQALHFHSAGVTAQDRVLLLTALDRFALDGMAQYRGVQVIGANVMRLGVGVADNEVLRRYLKFFRPTVLIGAPSVLRAAAVVCSEKNIDTAGSSVTKLFCGGEALYTRTLHRNTVASTLGELWGAEVFSLYTATEIAVAYGDCSAHAGLHAHPELVYTEIVDPEGKPVPDGTVGELVATPLGVEGVPLLRYRTGDMTFRVPGSCSCGRNSCRIGPVLGRTSQVFTCNGTEVYPLPLINALESVEEVKDYLVILEDETGRGDSVTIHVAAPPAAMVKIGAAVHEATGVHMQMLVSNIPTIQALRKGNPRKIPILDCRQQQRTPIAQPTT